MKKIICILVCLLILMSISIVACATNIDAIKSDTSTIVVGVTNTEVPIHGTLPSYNAGPNTTVIITPTQIIPTTPTENNNNQEKEETVASIEEDPAIPEPVAVIENELAEAIYNLVNEERTAKGLNTLAYEFKLQEAADLRAKEASEAFSHTRPNGTSCYTVFPEDYINAGENLIMSDIQIATADILMKTWMDSPGHRDNILSNKYSAISIGIYTKDNVVYASQLFIG